MFHFLKSKEIATLTFMTTILVTFIAFEFNTVVFVKLVTSSILILISVFFALAAAVLTKLVMFGIFSFCGFSIKRASVHETSNTRYFILYLSIIFSEHSIVNLINNIRYFIFKLSTFCIKNNFSDLVISLRYLSIFNKTFFSEIYCILIINQLVLGIVVSILFTFVTSLSYTFFLTILSTTLLGLLKLAGKVFGLSASNLSI